MIRMSSPLSVCETTMSRPVVDLPKVRCRGSSTEWSGSWIVDANESPNTVDASLKDTPWRASFLDAFSLKSKPYRGSRFDSIVPPFGTSITRWKCLLYRGRFPRRFQ